MQIHKLTAFSGMPSDNDYLAIDNGSETTKVPATNLGITTEMTAAELRDGIVSAPRVVSPEVAALLKVLVIENTVSSLPATINDPKITSDMVVIKSELGTPTAQTSDWTVETSDGSLTILGTVSGATTVKLYLAIQR